MIVRTDTCDNSRADIGSGTDGILGCLTRAFRFRGRHGFDVGYKAAQGIPRASDLVNTTGNAINANDERYALAA